MGRRLPLQAEEEAGHDGRAGARHPRPHRQALDEPDEEGQPAGPGVRLDSHCYSGYFVPPYYDSLLAKLIVHAKSRSESADQTKRALDDFHVNGIDTLIPFLQVVIDDAEYRAGAVNTRWLEKKLADYSAALSG